MDNYGETLGRNVALRIGAACASTTALAAIPAHKRVEGMLVVVTADQSLWVFDADGTATAGTDVIAVAAGSGQWLRASGSAGSNGAHLVACRGRSSGALAAYTRTANVILANAVGALGAQDGVTYTAGQLFYLSPTDAAAPADAGPYVIDDAGGATKFQFTRAPGADTGAEFPGMLVLCEEGTLYGDTIYQITNNSVTINVTAITDEVVPNTSWLAATTAGRGISLIGVADADSVIAGTNGETALTELAKRTLALVANNAALIALTAAKRTDGSLVVQADTMQLWIYDLGSAAAATDWVVVPTDGAGRWLLATPVDGRVLPPVADNAALLALTAGDRQDGSIIQKLDDNSVWCYDLGSVVAGVTDWTIEPTDGVGCWFRIDAPRGAILQPVADAAALVALTAADRIDGSIVVQLDTMQTWKYDLGSAAAASDWVVVPTDAVGRWLDMANPAGGLLLPPVADNAALIALTAVDRQDGSLVVQLDTMALYAYDLGSAEAASEWCVVPTDAVGRWLLQDALHGVIHAQVADRTALGAIPAAGRADGMSAVKLDDYTGWAFAAASVTAAGPAVAVPAAGAGRWHRGYVFSGQPMQNRLRMLGAPGAIAEGDFFTIGADVYEFRASTPPIGGTAGRTWLYNGATSAIGRATAADAINGVVDVNRIAYKAGGLVENFLAEADHVTVGDLTIVSAETEGGIPTPSATATVCTDNLTTVTDIWDAGACRMGSLAGSLQHSRSVVTVLAADITKGTIELHYGFVPFAYHVINRTAALNLEAVTIVGNSLSIALSGGAPPAIQANDVLNVYVSE